MAFIKVKDRYYSDYIINTDQICVVINKTSYYRFKLTNGEIIEISLSNTEDIDKLLKILDVTF